MTVTKHINTVHLNATGLAHTGPGILKRVLVYAAAAVVVQCYDSLAGTDNPLTIPLAVDVIGAEALALSKSFEVGARFDTGLRCVLTGTGECIVVIE